MIEGLELPVRLTARGADLVVRAARPDEQDTVVALLVDDPVSAARGDRADARAGALAALQGTPGTVQVVAETADRRVVGTLQLTLIPGLARGGTSRLQVEAVHVAATERSTGIGGALMRWVVDVVAPTLGAGLVQLTSDGRRADAHRFYERLGFVPSHVGFKLRLP